MVILAQYLSRISYHTGFCGCLTKTVSVLPGFLLAVLQWRLECTIEKCVACDDGIKRNALLEISWLVAVKCLPISFMHIYAHANAIKSMAMKTRSSCLLRAKLLTDVPTCKIFHNSCSPSLFCSFMISYWRPCFSISTKTTN